MAASPPGITSKKKEEKEEEGLGEEQEEPKASAKGTYYCVLEFSLRTILFSSPWPELGHMGNRRFKRNTLQLS